MWRRTTTTSVSVLWIELVVYVWHSGEAADCFGVHPVQCTGTRAYTHPIQSALTAWYTSLVVQKGRLKLRQVNGISQLIAYVRPDTDGPKTSEYNITLVPDAASLKLTLGMTLGIIGT